MKICSARLVIAGLVLGVATSWALADDAKQAAVKKDLQRLEGTWRVVALEVNGNKVVDEEARKISVVNRPDGTWTLYSDGKEVSRGTNSLDPTTSPKVIDFSPTSGGGEGNQYEGIYELGENTRKLCFAPPGKGRPSEFASPVGSEQILVTFEREKTP